jgi:predicted nucleotide-binding protein (sugar kinase/HSP70/actin superfamily)
METDLTKRDIKRTSSATRLEEQIAAEHARLLREADLSKPPARHYQRPVERPFTREERARVTILFGGLSFRHDRLLQAGLEGLGYKADRVPIPTKTDFQTGKEYGNNGQCNPTYFTVGALVNYLKRLRDKEGLPTEKILSDYVFVTGGACGPCRFGMYEAEYRLALCNAGFDGFRVILFDRDGGYSQSGMEAGLEMNLPFFLMFLNAVFIGDLLNAVAYHVRPYEIEPGKTNKVLEKCLTVCEEALRKKDYGTWQDNALKKLVAKIVPGDPNNNGSFLDQIGSTHYIRALKECRKIIDEEIEVDYTRPKPVVKVTGEFWAQTTEGDGNFNMFPFLENEGAEVLVEPVATYVDYSLSYNRQYTFDRHGLSDDKEPAGFWNFGKQLWLKVDYWRKAFFFNLVQKILTREYNRLRQALDSTLHPLANQLELERIAHPYYNSRAEGGEGHLEVAKNIYYINRDLAHMVLSLKPFGCMPSTQSDGVQTAVLANYPDIIFLPIETSGEGDINAYSRTQMALGEAKLKCKDEFKAVLQRTGYSLDELHDYIKQHRELCRPLQHVPHSKGIVGRAANFILHVAKLMDQDPVWGA